MFGAIIGDIVGRAYEHTRNNIKTTDIPLFSPASRFTDDTVMTVAIASGLVLGGNNSKLREWFAFPIGGG